MFCFLWILSHSERGQLKSPTYQNSSCNGLFHLFSFIFGRYDLSLHKVCLFSIMSWKPFVSSSSSVSLLYSFYFFLLIWLTASHGTHGQALCVSVGSSDSEMLLSSICQPSMTSRYCLNFLLNISRTKQSLAFFCNWPKDSSLVFIRKALTEGHFCFYEYKT